MMSIELYHGSPVVVEMPMLHAGKLHNDYGQGFYCTLDRNLACEWACKNSTSTGYVNSYTLDTDGLCVLNLDEAESGVLTWAATLMRFREVNFPAGVDVTGVEKFIDTYACDLRGVDVVQGYRADDSYFDIVRAFVGNRLSVSGLEQALHLGDLGKQFVLKSERAFLNLSFLDAHPVEGSTWYAKRSSRNKHACDIFRNCVLSRDDVHGTFFLDILRQLA